MRVLLTSDTVGGVWTYALELARALRRHDDDVLVAAAGPPLAPARREEAHAAGVALETREAALEWMDEPWEDVSRTGEWLFELAQSFDPDVVHLNEFAHATLPWDAPTLLAAHSCVLSWHAALGREPRGWDRYAEVVASALGRADLVVAPTRWMLDEFGRLYGPMRERIVIPNGRDATAFRPGRKEPFVMTAGRLWDEGKNVAALDRAAERLEWPVAASGDPGTWRPRSLHLLGPVPQARLAAWLGRASVFALPARYEPFGLAPLEAAYAGCALVLGDIPTLREVWEDAATFVDPDDDGALAAALRRLLRDEELRRERAEAARGRARIYTPERMAGAYGAAYERLCTRLPVGAR